MIACVKHVMAECRHRGHFLLRKREDRSFVQINPTTSSADRSRPEPKTTVYTKYYVRHTKLSVFVGVCHTDTHTLLQNKFFFFLKHTHGLALHSFISQQKRHHEMSKVKKRKRKQNSNRVPTHLWCLAP